MCHSRWLYYFAHYRARFAVFWNPTLFVVLNDLKFIPSTSFVFEKIFFSAKVPIIKPNPAFVAEGWGTIPGTGPGPRFLKINLDLKQMQIYLRSKNYFRLLKFRLKIVSRTFHLAFFGVIAVTDLVRAFVLMYLLLSQLCLSKLLWQNIRPCFFIS